MNIICPNCALRFPLIAGMNDADARRGAALMGEVPPALAPRLLEYLSLFKPPKSGLTWRRPHNLLGELVSTIKGGQVSRKGRTWAAPPEHWQMALQEIIDRRDKFTLPLKSHGYLLEVLTGLADKAEAEAERQREAQHRQCTESAQGAHSGHTQALRADLRHFYDMAPTKAIQGQIDTLIERIRDADGHD